MRIIGGNQKGKRILVSKKGVRPTRGLVREAIFNVIQDKVPLARVLDIFAGSGALGLEALSRGATMCVFIEKKPAILKKNIQYIAAHKETTIFNGDYRTALKHINKGPFSLIFLDPPYNKALIEPALALINERSLLQDNGTIVLEHHPHETYNIPAELIIVKKRKYGETMVTFIERSPTKD